MESEVERLQKLLGEMEDLAAATRPATSTAPPPVPVVTPSADVPPSVPELAASTSSPPPNVFDADGSSFAVPKMDDLQLPEFDGFAMPKFDGVSDALSMPKLDGFKMPKLDGLALPDGMSIPKLSMPKLDGVQLPEGMKMPNLNGVQLPEGMPMPKLDSVQLPENMQMLKLDAVSLPKLPEGMALPKLDSVTLPDGTVVALPKAEELPKLQGQSFSIPPDGLDFSIPPDLFENPLAIAALLLFFPMTFLPISYLFSPRSGGAETDFSVWPDLLEIERETQALSPEEQRKLKLETGTTHKPRTSTANPMSPDREGYMFFQGPTPKTARQTGMPDFFSEGNFANLQPPPLAPLVVIMGLISFVSVVTILVTN